MRKQGQEKSAGLIAGAAILVDLLSIAYFKYFNFLISSVLFFTGREPVHFDIVLPLGISFFTFQSIAFIIDSKKLELLEVDDFTLSEFALFISYFPQLIAGPIVHAKELVPQFRNSEQSKLTADNLADGLSVFLVGLGKKMLVADTLSQYVTPIFNAAESGENISFFVALYGMLAYSLQLYFDFSGYSDMAYGLGLMVGIKLPVNFNSPYKASCLIDFWSRWHITLSRFLRDYVYIPLGGNRNGKFKRFRNLLLTMLIGGLWHGAGWTFVIWGGLHGIGLICNHCWRLLSEKYSALEKIRSTLWWRIAASGLTIIFVFLAWVLFRAKNFLGARMIFRGLAGSNGAELPEQILNCLPGFCRSFISGTGTMPLLGNATIMGFVTETVMIAGALLLALLGSNVYEMSKRTRALVIFIVFYFVLQKLLFNVQDTEFLYFQF